QRRRLRRRAVLPTLHPPADHRAPTLRSPRRRRGRRAPGRRRGPRDPSADEDPTGADRAPVDGEGEVDAMSLPPTGEAAATTVEMRTIPIAQCPTELTHLVDYLLPYVHIQSKEGATGGGKSTLINELAGENAPVSGGIRFDGRPRWLGACGVAPWLAVEPDAP